MKWPPNFDAETKRRSLIERAINSVDDPRALAIELYADDPIRFISDCCITYDPRNPGKGLPARMPFILFPKQEDLIRYLLRKLNDQKDGLVEKSRDMGATWAACSFAVWLWLFVKGSSVGLGSRKEQLVDRIGDPDSIFEKIRMLIRAMPWYMVPENFNEKDHLSYMKCLNPDNDSTISGEAGDNIGRGGRKSIFIKDESAHYARPELIEASLGDNTDVQIDISSVYGEGNVFHRRRFGGIVEPFIMDWRDHPAKTQEWYDARRVKAESEGLLAEFAQEVDRDYSAAVEGIFIPSKYVKAALDAHLILGIKPSGERRAGLDVADEGGDLNALIASHGVVLTHIEKWGEGDTDYTAKKANDYAIRNKITRLRYDSIGVGSGIKGTIAALTRQEAEKGKKLPYEVTGFAAGGKVVNPDMEFTEGKTNEDMFSNIKAQAMWELYTRFYNVYRAVVEKDKNVDLDKIICIPSKLELATELVSEISRPKKEYNGAYKIKVESKETLSKRGVKSPNLLEALLINFAPEEKVMIHIG